MKRAPRSLQHHVLYRKYNGQDSEISALLGKCGVKRWLDMVLARPAVQRGLAVSAEMRATTNHTDPKVQALLFGNTPKG